MVIEIEYTNDKSVSSKIFEKFLRPSSCERRFSCLEPALASEYKTEAITTPLPFDGLSLLQSAKPAAGYASIIFASILFVSILFPLGESLDFCPCRAKVCNSIKIQVFMDANGPNIAKAYCHECAPLCGKKRISSTVERW